MSVKNAINEKSKLFSDDIMENDDSVAQSYLL